MPTVIPSGATGGGSQPSAAFACTGIFGSFGGSPISFGLSAPCDAATGASTHASASTVPALIASSGEVFYAQSAVLQGIPDVLTLEGFLATLTVTNQAATEIISVAGFTATVVDGVATIDWSTATPTAIAGSDLTWGGESGQVVSAAGGVFSAELDVLAAFA